MNRENQIVIYQTAGAGEGVCEGLGGGGVNTPAFPRRVKGAAWGEIRGAVSDVWVWGVGGVNHLKPFFCAGKGVTLTA